MRRFFRQDKPDDMAISLSAQPTILFILCILSNIRENLRRVWVIGLLCGVGVVLGAVPAGAVTPQFLADCQALTRHAHRLTGTPEYAAAADYVTQRLRGIGVPHVIAETFPTVRLQVKRCELVTAAGKTLPLQPARPDLLIPPTTPRAGITGALLYAGVGRLTDYRTRRPSGKIVVLDFNSGTAWLRAFRLGAAAVIFVNNGTCSSRDAHYVQTPANFPRYYYAGDRHDLLEGSVVTLHSEITWEHATGRNIIGFIPGTHPDMGMKKNEAIVLATNLDSYGEVPTLTPGARGAANCAALLATAAHLLATPPRRDTIIAFFDGQAHGHLGASAFYRALEHDTSTENVTIADRERNYAREMKFLNTILPRVRSLTTLSLQGAQANEVLQRLRNKAADHVSDINSTLEDLHKEEASEPHTRRAVDAQIAALLQQKGTWNNLQRALATVRSDADLAAVRRAPLADNMTRVLSEVRVDIAIREHELHDVGKALAADKQLDTLFGHDFIILHTALEFGDSSTRWAVIIGSNSNFYASATDSPGLYRKIQNTFQTACDALRADGRPLTLFEEDSVSAAAISSSTHLLFPAPLSHSGEIAGHLSIYNLAFGTVQELLAREGTPDDTLARLDLNRIESQSREMALLLGSASDMDGLSLNRSVTVDTDYHYPSIKADGSVEGPTVLGTSQGSSMPNTPMPDTVIALTFAPALNAPLNYQDTKIPGFDNFQLLMTDANATYGYGPITQDPTNTLLAGFAAKFDERGEVVNVSDNASTMQLKTRFNLLNCAGTAIVDGHTVPTRRNGAAVLTPQIEYYAPTVMQAVSNGELDASTEKKANFNTADGITYWYCEKSIDGIKVFGLQAMAGLLNGDDRAGFHLDHKPTADDALGSGFSLLTPWQFPEMSIRSAADTWRLDEYRLNILRDHGVMNSSLDELHGRAQDLLDNATQATTVAERESLAVASFNEQRQVYTQVRSSLDDLVRAVLILLTLAIPFAFSLERLLIGATNIYRQISWFVVFFSITFVILRFVHPAFANSNQPKIIFLAFALIVLSTLVIFVIMQKFESELKVLQGLTSTVHSADVSRFSTMMAAMNMGISTMRRRPLRTVLTSITIILLTFTILNFASFDTKSGIVTLFEGTTPKYTGALLHTVDWADIDPEILDTLAGRWGKTAVITTRYWLPASSDPLVAPLHNVLITHGDGSHPISLKGLLGLDPVEITQRADLQRLFGGKPERFQDGVFLSTSLASQLGVTVGDPVNIAGIPLHVAGLLDTTAVTGVKDIDDNGILPVDFATTSSSTQTSSNTQAKKPINATSVLSSVQKRQQWTQLPVDSVAIVSTESARRMGAGLRAVTLYTKDTQTATTIAEEIARMLPVPVTATRANGIYTHVLAPTMQAKGVKDLIFPILLGGLVIFGTMLGSVADREKEIYTFSALGLAPTHVATLFFAEALVYSFIGGLGGYLLAQGLLKIMTVLAQFGLVSVPEMNYSSFNAIITIVIVMCTVLISAIYPAIKASRSANPGILRSWRLPAPDGDIFHITFPFTVSQYDITGVVSFLKEHFDNFSDTSLGIFMARETKLVRDGSSLGIASQLALAPFDLGVTQDFVLKSAPSEIAGIDEVKIEITRRSGQDKDWERLNMVLLNELRKQFLIWRSLSQETMELYRQRTLVALAEVTDGAAPVAAPTVVVPETA